MSNQHSNTIESVLNKNHKQLSTQIDFFSINLHQHQQQLKAIIQSINQLVTFLQNKPTQSNNNQNITDELSQFTNNLQTKLELIAQCINNIESEQLQHLKDSILNALTETNTFISNKMDDKHKSFSIINATDLKQQSKNIVNSIQNIIDKNQLQKYNYKNQNNQKRDNKHLDTLKQINIKLSNIDLQTKVLNEEMQHMQNENKQSETNESETLYSIISNSEENILNKITNILPDIFSNVLTNYFHNQSNNNPNIDIQNQLSLISDKLCKMNIESENEDQLHKQFNVLFKQLQCIENIGKENDKNNVIILTKLQNKTQTIQTQLENVEQILSSSFQTTNPRQNVDNSDVLTTNVFLNRINAMEQRFESKLQKMSEQQTQFQKCVLEQLNQLISSNNVNKLNSMPIERSAPSQLKQNNMSLWMTVQNIDRNTNELNRKVKFLKEQQIAQFESIANLFCKQTESVSFQTNNVGKYVKDSKPIKPIVHKKSFLQQYQSYSPYSISDRSSQNSQNKQNMPRQVSISRKYITDTNSIKPAISSDSVKSNSNPQTVMDCDDLVTWSNMDTKEKQLYCQLLMTRLFATELYQHTVEPKNSFYLKYAKKIIEDWKVKQLWNDDNWELMDEKKLLISKMWSFMLINWNECIPQG